MDKRDQYTDEAYELLAGRFKVLAEPLRLKILNALQERELSVSEIVARVGCLQANASKHLGVMLDAGLLTRRKDGLSAYYSIADKSVFELCNIACQSLERRFKNQRDAIKFFK